MARILIVDDELSFRLLLQATLPLLGYEVAGVAADGAEALELARFLKPDLVLMDIVMPGALDGIEEAKKIRAELDIPVIFLTGCGNDEIVNRAKCADPFAFLIKPCGEEELKAAIELALHRQSRERRLNDALSSYREITEAVPHIFWLSTGDFSRILYVSPSYEKLWGRPPHEFLKDPLSSLSAIHPDEHPYILEKIERQKSGEVTEKVFRIVRSDGSLRWIKDCAFPIKDDDGNISRIAGISEDITEQMRAQQAATRTGKLLDAIRQAQALFILHPHERIVFAELLRMMVEVTESESGFIDEVLEDEKGSLYKINLALSNIAWDEGSRQLYEELTARNLEFRNLDSLAGAPVLTGSPVIANDPPSHPSFRGLPAGHPPLRSYLGIPIRFGGIIVGVMGVANRPGGYSQDLVDFLEPFVSTCATIIQAMRTERKEKKSSDRIAWAEEKLQFVFGAIKETVFLMSIDGTVELINEHGAARLGRRPEEIIGKSAYAFIPPETVAHRRKKVEEALRTGLPVQFEDSREGVWLSHYLYPINNESGKVDKLAIFAVDITARKYAEESLRASEEKYRRIVETAEEGIWLVDREWRTSFVNARMEQMLGYRPGEMLGRHLLEFMGEDEALSARESMARREDGARESHEFKFLRRDGTELWVLLSTNPLPDETGAFSGGLAMATDITERKRAEEALRASEERYRTVADFTYDWEYWLSPDKMFLYCSPSCERITGYRAEEFERDPDLLNTLIHPDDRDRFLLQMKVGEGRDSESQELEFRILTQSGEVRWLAHACQSVWGRDGAYLGRRASNRDITDRKRADEALRKSEERYRMIFNHAPLGIMHFDSKGIIRDFNDKFVGIMGASREDILAFNMLERLRDPVMLQAVKDAIEGRSGYYEGDYLSVTGGKSTPMRAIYQRITDQDDKILGAVCLIEDVTERKRAEEEKVKMEAHLRQAQKMEAIGTLAGGIAHDFNNVLSAIFGFTELSLGKAPPDSPIQADLQQVLLAAERAKELVKQILTFSRQSEQEVKPVRIVPLLKEALKFLRASIPSTIAIRQHIRTSSESTVLADPTQIHQVVMNLCTNASYAMRQSGGTLEVELSEIVLSEHEDLKLYPGLNPGEYLCLRVSDTGCGMDEGTIQRIFDPFFTTKPREEGTGMGLAVVYGIVKRCGGAITVRSKPGEGANFHLYFPKAPSPTPKPLFDAKAISGGKGRILFVDDEAALVKLEEKMLQGLGYTVVATTSSLEALAIFRSRPAEFDLLMTDYTMPQVTGLELIEEIRRIRADMPVILCSGYTEFLDRMNISDLGVHELIHKPISRRALAEAVRRLLPQA